MADPEELLAKDNPGTMEQSGSAGEATALGGALLLRAAARRGSSVPRHGSLLTHISAAIYQSIATGVSIANADCSRCALQDARRPDAAGSLRAIVPRGGEDGRGA